MRFRNTGQIKSVACSTKNLKIRDGLEIYCVAYKKKSVVMNRLMTCVLKKAILITMATREKIYLYFKFMFNFFLG